MVPSIAIYHSHQSFVYTQLNDQTVLFQTIQFSINHLFAFSLNVKQYYLAHRNDPIGCYHPGPKLTWEWWQWRGTLNSPKLQYDWSHTIRFFSVMSRTLVGVGVLPHCRDAVGVFYSLSQLGSQHSFLSQPFSYFLMLYKNKEPSLVLYLHCKKILVGWV